MAVDQVSVTAMKKNGKGKYQVTNNANKTDLVKVTFKLKSQKKGEIGRKEAHLVMQNPEGSVAEAKGIFTIKDSQTESKYTDHAIINYNNHDVDVTMFVQRKGTQFEKGVYPIKLFVEGCQDAIWVWHQPFVRDNADVDVAARDAKPGPHLICPHGLVASRLNPRMLLLKQL